MFICPKCNTALAKARTSAGVFWVCPGCRGRSATIALLRKNIPGPVVNAIWQDARSGERPRKLPCPACNRRMSEVPLRIGEQTPDLDVCPTCQFIWFDHEEFDTLPGIQPPSPGKELSPEARQQIALLEIEQIRKKADRDTDGGNHPNEAWQWLPGLLGLPVELEAESLRRIPLATWSTVLLVTLISLSAFFNLDVIVAQFGLVPASPGRLGGLTLLSSFFLHGGWFHLLSNMYFLLVFGDNVEDWLGWKTFLLLLLCSTLSGDLLHILGDPSSTLPCIGASGGISGVLAFYALKFPHVKLGFVFRYFLYFRWIRLPANAMFLLWIGLQFYGLYAQLAGFSNVSALAHIGGVLCGVFFWFATRKD